MTENTENLLLEILKDVQARLSRIENEITSTRVAINAMGQQIAGLTTAVYGGQDRVEDHERRLELRDET